MSGWKDWTVGEVVEEPDFQTYVQNQVVQNYANADARGSALGTAVAEGMVSYLQDTNAVEVFTGASWEAISGDITGVTAGTALTGGGTSGAVTLNVDQSALFTDGTSGFTMVSGGTAGVTYQPLSPNYIINGAFDIWQRGTSFTSAAYTADRWLLSTAGGAFTGSVSQQTFSPNDLNISGYGDANYYARMSLTDAASLTVFQLRQRVEDVRTLAGQTFTFSFWAKADSSRTVNWSAIQNFGSGGSSAVTGDTASFSVGTTWQRFTYTETLPSISGKTIGTGSYLEIRIEPPIVSGMTLDICGVQLEAGSVATPFRRNANSIQGELAACQRYYFRHTRTSALSDTPINIGYARSTTSARTVQYHPVPMRTSPTVSVSAAGDISIIQTGSAVVATGFGTFSASPDSVQLSLTTSGLTAGEGALVYFGGANVGYLEYSAEL